ARRHEPLRAIRDVHQPQVGNRVPVRSCQLPAPPRETDRQVQARREDLAFPEHPVRLVAGAIGHLANVARRRSGRVVEVQVVRALAVLHDDRRLADRARYLGPTGRPLPRPDLGAVPPEMESVGHPFPMPLPTRSKRAAIRRSMIVVTSSPSSWMGPISTLSVISPRLAATAADEAATPPPAGFGATPSLPPAAFASAAAASSAARVDATRPAANWSPSDCAAFL